MQMMKYLMIRVIVALNLLCIGSNVSAGSIMFIFEKFPKINDSFKEKTVTITTVMPGLIVHDGDDIHFIKPVVGKSTQQFDVGVKNARVVFKHRVNVYDYYEYVFNDGDTVKLTYNNGLPVVTVMNREVSKSDYQFESLTNIQTLKKRSSAASEFYHSSQYNRIKVSSPIKLPPPDLKILLALHKQVKKELKQSNRLLDSLNAARVISKDPYQYYKSRIAYVGHCVDVYVDSLGEADARKLLKETNLAPEDPRNLYHKRFLDAYADKFIVAGAENMDFKDGTNKDYRQIFDRITSETAFRDIDKSHLLTREIYRIAENFSNADFRKYLTKYETAVKDTALVNQAKDAFSLFFNEKANETKTLALLNNSQQPASFDEIKKRHAGKIIYVDFWASWCGPCREAFPSSTKLREELKDSKVAFVYLSIDATIMPWKNASAKEKLDGYRENYLIVNPKTSEFMKQQKLYTIPRYMIFDKAGKLIYANAPRVESGELKALLTKLAANP